MLKSLGGAPPAPMTPAAIRGQLGAGRLMDSGTRSRMETAFGADFSAVRVHTGAPATALTTQMNARAFALGRDVAFGAGEYQPGTLVGDALIAHELAHVVQQQGSEDEVAPMGAAPTASDALEHDADQSALGVLASLWGRTKGALGGLASLLGLAGKGAPKMRSGLSLSRCFECKKVPLYHANLAIFEFPGRKLDPATAAVGADAIWKAGAGITLDYNIVKVEEADAKKVIGQEPFEKKLPASECKLDYSFYPKESDEMESIRGMRKAKYNAFFLPEIHHSTSNEAIIDSKPGVRAAYISTGKCDGGFTLAHELGHYFLGEGHKQWSSPLMHSDNCIATVVDDECEIARNKV